jgi:transposase InsO family protein
MSTESTSRGWPWAGIDPAAWIRNWWTTFGLAPQSLIQPILPGWTITINGINSSAPQTEVEVVQRHSYGRQLGRMADALEALIEERGDGASSDERFTEFTSNQQRLDALPTWLHDYNYHRPHRALDGRNPMQLLNNLPGSHT